MIKRIYLIQTGKIKKGRETSERLSKSVHLTYMGNAEYEFGALPCSLQDLESKKTEIKLFESEKIKDPEGNPLIFLAYLDEKTFKEYEKDMKDVLKNSRRLKSPLPLRSIVNPGKHEEKYGPPPEDFFWDIENNVMMSFDKAFMKDLPSILQASWDYMNPPQEDLENAPKM